jgi:hypothetical protein
MAIQNTISIPVYLPGLLLLETKRNYVHIARRLINPADDGQNIQPYMSDSLWSVQKVFAPIQPENPIA